MLWHAKALGGFYVAIDTAICENSRIMAEIHEGDVVRKLRETRSWSKDRLAAAAGVRPNTIGEMERTGARNLQTLRSVAQALGISVEDIFCLLRELKKPEPPAASTGQQVNPAHRKLHEYFEYILCTGSPQAGWLAGNIATFYAQLTGTEPDTGAVAEVQADRVSGDPGELHDLPEPSVGVANRRSRSKHGWRG